MPSNSRKRIRITIKLESVIWREVKAFCAMEGKSIGETVERLIEAELKRNSLSDKKHT